MKAEISDAEKQQEQLAKRRNSLELNVDRHQAMLRDGRRAKVRAQEALAAAQADTAKLKSAERDARKIYEEKAAERDAEMKKLEECEKQLKAERAEADLAKAARRGLIMAQQALGDVHEELDALSSDAAKKAALEAEGGELPTDLVPAPAKPATTDVDPETLWGKAPMRDEIRQAFQSQLVLTTLQKSLSVRAAEMRESLRQLGFAHGATVRTQQLCKVATGDQSTSESRAAEHAVDEGRAAADCDTEQGELQRMRSQQEGLEQRRAVLLQQLKSEEGSVASLREEIRSKREALEAARLQHEETSRAHEEAGKEVEARQAALQEHPNEAQRRLTAAERLACMSEEKTHRGLQELQQAQEQLISFQQAHRAMQQAHAQLAEQLVAQKRATKALQAEHELQNMELAALAQHYMAAIPPMPGFEKLAAEPDPPPAPEKPAKEEAAAPEAEKAAIGRTPSPPTQPRHLDPTGMGALSAGGRLVLSI